MKKIGISILLITSLVSCGDSCYKCWVESYWNGISYTKTGESYEVCPDDGETEEQFEQRIKDKEDCEDCHTICVKK